MVSKKCKICRAPTRPFKTTCGLDCEVALGIQLLEKKKRVESKRERMEDAQRREALGGIKHQLELTQAVINAYVLARNPDMPCMACGKSAHSGVRHSSHYKSRGSNSYLRFNLWNIWPCCYSCNAKKGGNIIEMRRGMVALLGVDRVEWLENAPRSRKYDIDYLKRMRKIFAKKTRRLKNNKAA